MSTQARAVGTFVGLLALLVMGGCSLFPFFGNQPPQAHFSFFPNVPLMDTEVFFDASESKDPEGQSLSFQWAFGDGQQDMGEIVSHLYAHAGLYQVTLTVVDEGGAKGSLTKTLVVAAPVGRVLSRFKAPAEQPSALTWDGQAIWVADSLTNKIYRINPQTGQMLSQLTPLPDASPEGLVWDGQTLWIAEVSQGQLHQINPQNGRVLQSFALPGVGIAFPNGLAWDGEALWVAEGIGSRIYRLDPQAKQILQSFAAPGALLEDLTWDGQNQSLWVLDGIDGVLQIDSNSGQILKALGALPEGSPKGLLWLGSSLWLIVDNQLYRVEPGSQ